MSKVRSEEVLDAVARCSVVISCKNCGALNSKDVDADRRMVWRDVNICWDKLNDEDESVQETFRSYCE